MSLVDVLNQLEVADEELHKEAAEQEKLAAEEEAAGRIMARGFMDELNKLAADSGMTFKPEVVTRSKPKPAPKSTSKVEVGKPTLTRAGTPELPNRGAGFPKLK